MSANSRDRWLILAAEGVAVVVSIPLAFAIDAWWDERSERRQEAVLRQGLHADFQASQAQLERWLTENRVVKDANSSHARAKHPRFAIVFPPAILKFALTISP